MRGDLLAKLGRFHEARQEFKRAAAHAQRPLATCSLSVPEPAAAVERRPSCGDEGGASRALHTFQASRLCFVC